MGATSHAGRFDGLYIMTFVIALSLVVVNSEGICQRFFPLPFPWPPSSPLQDHQLADMRALFAPFAGGGPGAAPSSSSFSAAATSAGAIEGGGAPSTATPDSSAKPTSERPIPADGGAPPAPSTSGQGPVSAAGGGIRDAPGSCSAGGAPPPPPAAHPASAAPPTSPYPSHTPALLPAPSPPSLERD